MKTGRVAISVMLGLSLITITSVAAPIRVGSKQFTENIILAELVTQLLRHRGITVEHKPGLGGTRILWEALLTGAIDVYPEYTGTVSQELLADLNISDPRHLQAVLAGYGVVMSPALGFDNTYILGVMGDRARKLNLKKISDLTRYPELRLGFSNEFMSRADGWPGLKDRYSLQTMRVTGLEHTLSYHGLVNGDLDVIDLYSTDAEIAYYGIQPLEDDQRYFPEYLAVFLYRQSLQDDHPGIHDSIQTLAGRIDAGRMAAMNAEVKIHRRSEHSVAADYLHDEMGIRMRSNENPALENLARNTFDHMYLVFISLSAAISVGIPLGILSARRQRFGQIMLAVTGAIQTLPALALLVFMIPVLGIGGPPAVVALFLYSLFPILRNTYCGLHDIPRPLLESAIAMGLPPGARMRRVELPLATRSILTGIKISAVLNVGTATLGALIGAGGYGQPILTGIRLNDIGLILQGAVPAAVMALAVQAAFDIIESRLLPRGLRYTPSRD
jgi:osmoprotectant transport system permease protein